MLDKTLVSIAGYDPTGGAGVLLDIAVFRRFGFRGAGLLTAATAQNSRTVSEVRSLGGPFLLRQYETLVQEVDILGIKVGMIAGPGNVNALGRVLVRNAGLPIVVDPVFRSSSGRWLLERKYVRSYLDGIKGRITLLTPNLDEASLISGLRLQKPDDMKKAARTICNKVAAPCLLKGGHLTGSAIDVLYDGRQFFLFPHKKIPLDVHGTGCFLSSSLLCYLVQKKALPEACSLAIEFTQTAIKKAVTWGKGRATLLEF